MLKHRVEKMPEETLEELEKMAENLPRRPSHGKQIVLFGVVC